MKSKELNEMKEMTIEELGASLKEKKSELFNLRFQQATGQLENTALIPALKRDIARVLTIIRQRQDGAQA